jgi:hypothetical protein
MDWTKAFTATDTTKFFLDGDHKFWILVRNELSHAEQRRIGLATVRSYTKPTSPDADTLELNLGAGADRKLLTYLVDWNLIGLDGKTIMIDTEDTKQAALRNLLPAAYKAIEDLIDQHVAAQQEKKVPNGGSASAPISS